MRRVMIGLYLGCALAAQTPQQKTPVPDPWAPWAFLLGEWKGEGSGAPGEGGGAFTLLPELERKVLVRRNTSDYPAANGRPAVHHEDLMVISAEGGATRATYWDNEGHVIRYNVAIKASGVLEMTSEPQPASPRFRLTYTSTGPEAVSIRFELSPPGKDEAWKTYVEGRATRIRH